MGLNPTMFCTKHMIFRFSAAQEFQPQNANARLMLTSPIPDHTDQALFESVNAMASDAGFSNPRQCT